jgi:hypothetical protein
VEGFTHYPVLRISLHYPSSPRPKDPLGAKAEALGEQLAATSVSGGLKRTTEKDFTWKRCRREAFCREMRVYVCMVLDYWLRLKKNLKKKKIRSSLASWAKTLIGANADEYLSAQSNRKQSCFAHLKPNVKRSKILTSNNEFKKSNNNKNVKNFFIYLNICFIPYNHLLNG